MKIRDRIFIVIAAMAVLIGGYLGVRVYLRASLKKEGEELLKQMMETRANSAGPEYLVQLDSRSINKLVLYNAGLTLEKINDKWEITAPASSRRYAVDQNVVQRAALSLAAIFIDRLVEEEPADLSRYGLDNPSAKIEIADSSGGRAVIIAGDPTPSRTGYYMQSQGKPAVCIVSGYSGDNMFLDLNKIRDKTLFTGFEMPDVQSFSLETPRQNIEIILKPANMYGVTVFTIHAMLKPYEAPRGVDPDKFAAITESLKDLKVSDYVDYDPASYEPYGLDKPSRLSMETSKGNLNLLIGKAAGADYHYAKLPDNREVFTLFGLKELLDVKPFELTDKFAIILNIDGIEGFRIEGAGRRIIAGISGKGDNAVFLVNGRQAEDEDFRAFYKTVIGLMADAEFPPDVDLPKGRSDEDIYMEYTLLEPRGLKMSMELIPFNRDFYAMRESGQDQPELLVARQQLKTMFDSFEALGYVK